MKGDNEFKNKVYNAMIGEIERQAEHRVYKGDARQLGQTLTNYVDVAFRDVIMTDRREQDARREQMRKAFDEIAGDLIDMDTYMKNIDLHIQWLGAALPAESVVIPEFLAAVNTLNRISARLAAVGIVLSTE